MSNSQRFVYYVEGEDEKKLVNVLKSDFGCIYAGKVHVLNPIFQQITNFHLMNLSPNTNVILVFDTDVESAGCLSSNIKLLKSSANVKNVYCITQVKNIEDELCRACGIKSIRELTKSATDAHFKHDWLKCTNPKERLLGCGFIADRLWAKAAEAPFDVFENQADKIRITLR